MSISIAGHKVSEIRKTIVAGAGVLAMVLTSVLAIGVLPSAASVAVTAVVGFLTALGVFLTKNAPLIDAA